MPDDDSTVSADPTPAAAAELAGTADMGQSGRTGSRPVHKELTHIGPYRILETIGQGGMGIVYKAEQREPMRRIVAIKVIKLGMDTREVVARFEAERQALAMLSHPNVARVFDAGVTENGRPYFAMEHVAGIPLTQYCEESRLTTRQRLELFIPICQAVQHAHQKGIIHRDLKPTNILITLVDGKPVPKVIDFGIAKATNQALTQHTLFTQTGALIGTPAYMSPEQAMTSGLDVDTRTDIYSLGVILYELLTSTLPLDEKSLREAGMEGMVRLIKNSEPQKPSTRLATLAGDAESDVTLGKTRNTRLVERELRGDLDWIVLKALEKDRSRRYDTANGLAADINRHLSNEPVLARPPTTVYRLQKAFRRNRVAFTAAVVVATALVVGIAVSTRQTIQARAAQRDAEEARNGEQQQRLEAQSAKNIAENSQQKSRRLLYASDMNLAQQTLKRNNLGQARRLLERHRPQQPGDEDLRGWEWRYLWQLTQSNALVTLTNRPSRGSSVSFSADGSRLAVGWWDGHVDLWDVRGGRLIRSLARGEQQLEGQVVFSPVGNLLAATSDPKVVSLYDLDSGRESVLWRAPDQGAWEVRDLAFSQDGSRLVIYAGSTAEVGDEVCVVNVSSGQIESRHPTVSSAIFCGAARLSSDNQRLYLTRRRTIQCLDLATGQELWQTESERDWGITKLALAPDGRFLVSGSAFLDPTIRVWNAATGQLHRQLDGHTSWVSTLVFTRDGRRLISAAADQTIRFWGTDNWTETQVLRGHSDEIHALAISEPGNLVASAGKDGNLLLWKDDGKSATEGKIALAEDLGINQVMPLDHSRLLLLAPGKPPELVDLKRDSPPRSLPEIGSSTDVLGCFETNILFHWNGTNQILVRELRDTEFIQRGAITVDSGMRPTGMAYNPACQLVAWTEGSSNSIYLASLSAPGRRIELKSDVLGLLPFRFSENGNYLAAKGRDTLRVWNVESGQMVASIDEGFSAATFAAGGRVMVVAAPLPSEGHEIRFYGLAHPSRQPPRVAGKHNVPALAVSPDGGLVAASTWGGPVRLFDPAKGEWIDDLHGHMHASHGVAFSPDGRRLISSFGGREAVKVWDVATRQELLNLVGNDSEEDVVRWSADGDVILAGPPWQAWRAPSWEEIAEAEAKAKEKKESKQP